MTLDLLDILRDFRVLDNPSSMRLLSQNALMISFIQRIERHFVDCREAAGAGETIVAAGNYFELDHPVASAADDKSTATAGSCAFYTRSPALDTESGRLELKKSPVKWWCGGGLDGRTKRSSEVLDVTFNPPTRSNRSRTRSSGILAPGTVTVGHRPWTDQLVSPVQFRKSSQTQRNMGSKVNGAAPNLDVKSEPVAGNGQQQQVPNPPQQRVKPIRLKNHSAGSESYDTLHRSANPVSKNIKQDDKC